MRHQVFAGPFEFLEARLLATIAELQRSDPLAPVAILVGSNILASYLKGRIAARGRGAANVRFCTFLDLATKLAGTGSMESGRPRLQRLAGARILDDLLATHKSPPFMEVAALPGFRAAVLDTFRDLRDAGVGAVLLDKASASLIRLEPDRADHLRGLADLYRRYRESVGRFRDVDDDFRDAIAGAARVRSVLQTSDLLVYGIYDVTGQQAVLLDSLRDFLGLTYYVPYSNPSSSSFAERFLREKESALGTQTVYLQPEPKTSLALLADRIFSSCSGSALPADGSFGLVSVPGASRAAVEVVRELLRAVRDGVISSFTEAAVVLRHPEEDLPLLTEALRMHAIPYYIQGGISFAERPLAQAVMSLLELEPGGFSRQAILTAMELIAAALPADRAEAWAVAEWRALTNQAGFLGGLDAWNEGTLALVQSAEEDLRRAEEQGGQGSDEEEERPVSLHRLRSRLASARALRAGWQSLSLALAGWPETHSWPGWADLLFDRLCPLFEECPEWAVLAAVLEAVGDLQQTVVSGASPPVPRSRLNPVIGEALRGHVCAQGRFRRDGVNLLSCTAARGLRFPLVILPGMDEGRFPSRLRQDPLLLDHERQHIGAPARLPMKSLRGDEEKLLFDMAVRSAAKRLVLLTSRLDEGTDRERIPSDFFLRAAAGACGRTIGLRGLTSASIPGFRSVSLENPAPAPGLPAVGAGEIRLRLITENRAHAAAVLADLAREDPALLEGPLAFDRARWNALLTAYDGHIKRPQLVLWLRQRLGPGAGQVSASRMEEYAKCPYYFYLRRALELAPWEEVEPALALDPLDRGSVVHRILEGFLRSIPARDWVGQSPSQLWRDMESLARQELELVRPAGIPDLLWEIERERLLRLVGNWLEFEKERTGMDLVPARFEQPFGSMGGETDLPPYRVRAGRHDFAFRGRVDRIDISPDGRRARLIDYKVGRLPDPMGRRVRRLLMSGEKIQLAVYCGALSTLPEFSSVVESEGEYLHLQPGDGQVLPCTFGDHLLIEAGARLVQMLAVIGDLIRAGVFFARSKGTVRPYGQCDYCEFLAICGKDRVQREKRKSRDPAVERFNSLSVIDSPSEAFS